MFFFSSRRRHTRYIGDWSSDVCSSDLRLRRNLGRALFLLTVLSACGPGERAAVVSSPSTPSALTLPSEIGRASCRERVDADVARGAVEKKPSATGLTGTLTSHQVCATS